MLAGVVQAPSRLAPTNNLKLAQARSKLVLNAMADTGEVTQVRANAPTPARPGLSVIEDSDGHLFRRLGLARSARRLRSGLWRSEGAHDTRCRSAAARGPGASHAAAQHARRAGRNASRRPSRRDGRRQELQGQSRSTGRRRHAASRARRSSCSSISPPFVPAIRPTASSRTARSPSTAGRRQQRRRLSRPDHHARGLRPFEQCGGGAAFGSGRQANVMRAARELGITTPLPNSPSIALGTAGVSLLELTSAYAAVASGRYPIAHAACRTRRTRAIAGMLQAGGRMDSASRLGADARSALCGRQ